MLPKKVATTSAAARRVMPKNSSSSPKVSRERSVAVAGLLWLTAMVCSFQPGGFSRPGCAPRRDTYITPCRRKSNPTESTRLLGQNSSGLKNKSPQTGAIPYIAKKRLPSAPRRRTDWVFPRPYTRRRRQRAVPQRPAPPLWPGAPAPRPVPPPTQPPWAAAALRPPPGEFKPRGFGPKNKKAPALK